MIQKHPHTPIGRGGHATLPYITLIIFSQFVIIARANGFINLLSYLKTKPPIFKNFFALSK